MSLASYLRELRDARRDKPSQVKEALGIYIQLWERVIQKGLVRPEEDVIEALRKVEGSGGLHQAAEA